MIPFSIATQVPGEQENIFAVRSAISERRNTDFNALCEGLLAEIVGIDPEGVIMTQSCTQALGLAALLLEVGPGDEVIVPSFTHVSTANAFAMRGATPVFADVDPATMNISEAAIHSCISPNTKGVVISHYGGNPCNLEAITLLANQSGLWLLEDNAHGIYSSYEGKQLGTFGKMGCLSFGNLKNLTCGQGGALIVNDPFLREKARIARNYGTDKHLFLRGKADFYSWRGLGINGQLSELNAAVLAAQLNEIEAIHLERTLAWNTYNDLLRGKVEKYGIQLAPNQNFNGHVFWMKASGKAERDAMIAHLSSRGVIAPFHYIPLHQTQFGKVIGKTPHSMRNTEEGADRLFRLPLFYGIKENEIHQVCEEILGFLKA